MKSFALLSNRILSALALPAFFLISSNFLNAQSEVGFLIPCRVNGVQGTVFCANLNVQEDVFSQTGRSIQLKIVVLPATGKEVAGDAVFYLAGGPGQAATEAAVRVAAEHAKTRKLRDIVLIDQRGTGFSNPLSCKPFPEDDIRNYLGPPPGPSEIQKCKEQLDHQANVKFYSTPYAVEDLETARKALGYLKIDLDGGAYGSRVALVYMRKYPQNVRSATLRAVSAPDLSDSFAFVEAGQKALEQLIADCTADTTCHGSFPHFREELNAVLSKLSRESQKVQVFNPATGKEVAGELSHDTAVARLHLMLFSPELSRRIPFLIHEAFTGNYRPFAQLSADLGKAILQQIYFGMQLSVVCTEDIPYDKQQKIRLKLMKGFLGVERFDRFSEYCKIWGQGPLEAGYHDPVISSIPTLLISGAVDPATPAENAAEVRKHLSQSWQFVIPNGSHMSGGACVDSIVTRFIETASGDKIDGSCLQKITRIPFSTSNVRRPNQ